MGFGSHCSDNNPDVIEVQTRKHLSGEECRGEEGLHCALTNVVYIQPVIHQLVGDWVLAAGEPQYSTIIKGTHVEYSC